MGSDFEEKTGLKLLIVHYHFRPGGIRRIIEAATPALLSVCTKEEIDEVVLAAGEANDGEWNRTFSERLKPVACRFVLFPSWNYLSEQRRSAEVVRREIRQSLSGLIRKQEKWFVWIHNPGVGRNLILIDELLEALAGSGASVVFHQHDWWFDNRWQRWSEIRGSGFRTSARIAETVFANASNVQHVAINQADAALLRNEFSDRAHWLPNLTERGTAVMARGQKSVRRWLVEQCGTEGKPVWILPCRLLRRKNVAEAILLARWLRPEAWLLTTGSVSSAQEMAYAEKLKAAIREQRWQVRLEVLKKKHAGVPTVSALLAASEAVLLTSVQEGFGLPYIEAAAAGRPLIARELPNVSPDLAKLGFRFPYQYEEIQIDKSLFDAVAEQKRQRRLFRAWRQNLPGICQGKVSQPDWLEQSSVPFSRLTLTAQLEVLRHPREQSWEICSRLNPFLNVWRADAEEEMETTPWPSREKNRLSSESYARKLFQIFRLASANGKRTGDSEALQKRFFREKLRSANLFPLLWSETT